MAIEIRETTIAPIPKGYGVQLHIADAPIDDESASFVLTMSVEVLTAENDQLSQIQREALKVASEALRAMINAMAQT